MKKVDKTEILSLYKKGTGSEDIAKELGVNTNIVKDIVDAYNEELPKNVFGDINTYLDTIDEQIERLNEIMDKEYGAQDWSDYKKSYNLWLESIMARMKLLKDCNQLSAYLK